MAELKDLVQFALDKQPSKFKEAFGELVAQRVVDQVDALKADVAANMFGEAPETDEDEDDLDLDLDLEDDDDVITDEDLEDIDFNFDEDDVEDLDDEGDDE